ncbi:hypothetical protein [Vibrio hibernica]|uniref:hypothetical protein n=1 Tax=Vibrio hibernica TaxID=2587465 RepID=UPI001882118F|nr:hypothetical protein [Vibrio hibernica]
MMKQNIVFSIGALIIVSLWGINYYLLIDFPNDVRGTFGDMFGAVNALFSGFAFLGVIYAILLQRKELSLQREELSLTRNELKKSAEAQEKSELALSRQAKSLELSAKINANSALLDSLKNKEKMYDYYASQNPEHQRQKNMERTQLHHEMVKVQERIEKLITDS